LLLHQVRPGLLPFFQAGSVSRETGGRACRVRTMLPTVSIITSKAVIFIDLTWFLEESRNKYIKLLA
jgi:hypothetical protein